MVDKLLSALVREIATIKITGTGGAADKVRNTGALPFNDPPPDRDELIAAHREGVELAMLFIVDDGLDFETYNKIAMALFNASGGTDWGLELFEKFARNSPKFKPNDHKGLPAVRWATWRRGSAARYLGFAHLRKTAEQFGWDPPAELRQTVADQKAITICENVIAKLRAKMAEAKQRDSGGHNKNEGALPLAGDPDGPLLLAASPETALSVSRATGCETRITPGWIIKEKLPVGRVIIICRDDYKHNGRPFNTLRTTVRRWTADGLDIRIATPWAEQREDGSGFNDLGGCAAVAERINMVLDQPDDTIRVSLEEARSQIDKAVSDFFAAAQ